MIRRLSTHQYCHDLVCVGTQCAPHPPSPLHMPGAEDNICKVTCPPCFDSCPTCAQSIAFTWICISDSSSKPQSASHDLNARMQWACNHDMCVLTKSGSMRYAMHKHQEQKPTPSMTPWASHQHVQMSMRARDNQIGTPGHQAHNNQHEPPL